MLRMSRQLLKQILTILSFAPSGTDLLFVLIKPCKQLLLFDHTPLPYHDYGEIICPKHVVDVSARKTGKINNEKVFTCTFRRADDLLFAFCISKWCCFNEAN